jgi:type I restriction enzyme S subunit
LFYALTLRHSEIAFDWVKKAHPSVIRKLYADIPLPPLPEQQRIVALLDEAFAGLATAKANAERNLQSARAIFESHLQSVFSQRGPGWMEKPLSELCERITKGSSPKWQGISYVDSPGVLFVTSENVGEYAILLNQPKYVEDKFNAKDKKSILKSGDVLTNIVGASIGRTAVFGRDDVANINQAVCLIRCEPHLLNNYYLAYLLNSPVFKQVLHDNEVNNARANLSLGFFSQLLVPMPSIPKQREIVAKLDAFREETQRLTRLYERKLAALEELKKSLLHQAFNGEL